MIGYNNGKCKAFGCINRKFVKLKKGYVYENGKYRKIYSAGNIVTYYVDSGTYYTEEVDSDASCLSPKTFTPSKDGWSFVGWRKDKTASNYVLGEYGVGENDFIDTEQYIDFTKDFSLHTRIKIPEGSKRYLLFGDYLGASADEVLNVEINTSNKLRLYLWGGVEEYISNATIPINKWVDITVTWTSASGKLTYTIASDSTNETMSKTYGTHSEVGVRTLRVGRDYRAGDGTFSDFTLDNDCIMGDEPISLYAVFSKKVTATFVSYGSTQYASAYKYYNNGNEANPEVTCPTGASYSGWSWRGWSAATDTTANASVQFANGDTVYNLWNDFTYYGLYQKSLVQTFVNGNGTTTTTAYAYYNASGNSKDATITMPSVASKSGWSVRGWSDNGISADATVYYSGGETNVKVTIANIFCALYSQTITLSYKVNGSTSSKTGTRYYNAYGNTSNPSFTISNPSLSGATFKGWSASSGSTTVSYSSISGTTFNSNTTIYAVFKYSDYSNTFYINEGNFPNIDTWYTTNLVALSTARYASASVSASITSNNDDWDWCDVNVYYGGTQLLYMPVGGAGVTKTYNATISLASSDTYVNYKYCRGSIYRIASGYITVSATGKTIVG